MASYKSPDPRVQEFLASKLAPGDIKPRTATEYARDIDRFARFLDGRATPPYHKLYEANKHDINRWLSHILESNLANSASRKLSALREFFKFQQSEGHRKDNPTEKVELPKALKRNRELLILSRDEIHDLLNAPDVEFATRDKASAARDKAMLHFLYSGPKRHELPTVTVDDVDLENNQIRVSGRMVPLTKAAAAAISAYLDVRPKVAEKALFVTQRKGPMTVRQLWVIVKKYVRRSGLNTSAHLETMRASYAVHALEDGVWFMDVLAALGNVTMTILQDYGKLANVASRSPNSGSGKVLTSAGPYIKFSESLREIRSTAVDVILKHAQGNTSAPSDAKPTVAGQVKGIAESWPSIVTEDAFKSLKVHGLQAQISDYHDILNHDLPLLEKAALESLKATEEKKEEVGVIALLHPRVIKESLRHYEDGDYREAVLNAMLALTEIIRERSGLETDGVPLASRVFKPEDPILSFSDLRTPTGRDEQDGFHKIIMGAFQGVRNPSSHSFVSDLTPQSAAQYLVFISLLVHRVEEARKAPKRLE
jgi:uncharacterized protein (TIGR02391 family)